MARREPLSAQELAICSRLRDFRLSTKIPRAAFAISVGISSDRLSEHENGRVPVRFEVFKAVHQEFYVNPQWLVEGQGVTTFQESLDFSRMEVPCRPRDLLSECFEKGLKKMVQRYHTDFAVDFFRHGVFAARLDEYLRLLDKPGAMDFLPEDSLEEIATRLEALLAKIRSR